MLVSYNLDAVGDVLLIIAGNSKDQEVESISQGDVTCVRVKETKDIVGWNIFRASHHVTNLEGKGQIKLSPSQMTEVNLVLRESGFDTQLEWDNSPKFVIGYVETSEAHPDSDHLTVNQIKVDQDESLQIVCGAANMTAGLKVVVAKVGAMMPNGLVIWPGELRGVASHGMVCSASELGLPNESGKKGILELDETAVIGESFVF